MVGLGDAIAVEQSEIMKTTNVNLGGNLRMTDRALQEKQDRAAKSLLRVYRHSLHSIPVN